MSSDLRRATQALRARRLGLRLSQRRKERQEERRGCGPRSGSWRPRLVEGVQRRRRKLSRVLDVSKPCLIGTVSAPGALPLDSLSTRDNLHCDDRSSDRLLARTVRPGVASRLRRRSRPTRRVLSRPAAAHRAHRKHRGSWSQREADHRHSDRRPAAGGARSVRRGDSRAWLRTPRSSRHSQAETTFVEGRRARITSTL